MQWSKLPPAWLDTFDSLLPQEAGRGAGGLHWKRAGRGTNQKAMEEAAPASCLCRENGTPAPTEGNWGKRPEGLWSSVCWACTLPASTSLLVDDPTATCTGSNSQPPVQCSAVLQGHQVK